MAEFLASLIQIPLQHLVDGAKVQYRYLFRFGSFSTKLDKEVEDLKSAQERVTSHVVTDSMDGRTIFEDVKRWREDVPVILGEADSLKEEMVNKKGYLMGRTCWYQLSKKNSEVRLPRGHSSIPYTSSKDFLPSKSSDTAHRQLMESLKNESTKMIWLYGMGGVGKTTLAERVIESVKDSKLFDKVVMVVVSQTPDLMAIQDKVAAVLRLKFEDENDVRTKAGPLSLRLENEEKILIILDDIWNFIDLPSIGITFNADQKFCKIFVTTRYRGVCSQMKCNKEIHIDVMSKTEALDLFKERAGLDDASPMIDIATRVAKECGGLPIAVVPLARALRNNTPNQWEDALMCLRESRLVDIQNVDDENAYKCLKVTYNTLKRNTKLCFLMCSLFPEDHEIEIEFLVRYAWGLGVTDSIEKARIQVQSSVDHLKDYCLLIASGTNKVKMHDVVRHFALWIASNQDNFFTAGYTESSNELTLNKSFQVYIAISLMIKGTKEFPSQLVFKELKLLLLGGGRGTRVSDISFKKMGALKVITISRCSLLPKLPEISINLRALHLEFCKVGDVSSLRQLKKLEILSFCSSDIRELPDEIGEMNDLKLLDLSSCKHLERIPPGLIQKLSRLEELYVNGSRFNPWEATKTTNSRGKANLVELNSLQELKVLSLDYKVENLLPVNFVPPNLTRYEISDMRHLSTREQWSRGGFQNLKTLEIDVLNDIAFSAFKSVFPSVEHFSSNSNEKLLCIVPDIEPRGFNNIMSLSLTSWRKMICLIDTKGRKVTTTPFLNLKKLILSEMENLIEVCQGQIPDMFLQKLETLLLYQCPKLCSIFQLPEGVKKENIMLFSSLVTLKLCELAELSCVWKGSTENLSLNSVTNVELDGCRKLASVFSLSMAQTLVHLKRLKISNCDELEYIIKEGENVEESCLSHGHVFLSRLEYVFIRECNKLKYIFPTFIAPSSCQQLQDLYLENNAALEQIFKHGQGRQIDVELSNLKKLTIELSPRLISFTGGYSSSLSLPFLKVLQISACAIQCPPHLEAKKLRQVVLSDVPKEWLSRLNDDLPNLEELQLQYLEGVEQVIRLESNTDRSDLLLSIESLTLQSLPQLAHIWNCPSYTSLLQNLTVLKVYSCLKLSYILPPTLAHDLPTLRELDVQDCNELVQMIGNDEERDPNHLRVMSFPNLENIKIRRCNKIKFIFPLSVVHSLPKLAILDVKGGDILEFVFGNETLEAIKDAMGEAEAEAVLPVLVELKLRELPGLVGFSVPGLNYIFPSMSMTELKVEECPNMAKRFTVSDSDGYLRI